MRSMNSSASPSGWNWVAYTLSPMRNICTGQSLPVISNVVPSGVVSQASLWPSSTSICVGKPVSSGSCLPASVMSSLTQPTASPYFVLMRVPRYRPSRPLPEQAPRKGKVPGYDLFQQVHEIRFDLFLDVGFFVFGRADIERAATDDDGGVIVKFDVVRDAVLLDTYPARVFSL